MIANTSEIVLGATAMEITRNPTASNNTELLPKAQITGVFPIKINSKPAPPDDQNWKYRFDDIIMVDVRMSDGNNFSFDLQEITNQPTWSADLLGQQTCIADINAWL
jgi:hypothetical protein